MEFRFKGMFLLGCFCWHMPGAEHVLSHASSSYTLHHPPRQVERNAFELTGQPPVHIMNLEQLAARITGALNEAVEITRKKGLLEDALKGPGGMGSYRPPPDFASLMDALTSPDWLQRMSLPANLETLRVRAWRVGWRLRRSCLRRES